MAKRQNRLKPIDHERRQLENLKTLDPVQTPQEYLPLSNALIDLALMALNEVYWLEEGNPPFAKRLQTIHEMMEELKALAQVD